jgi:hypothetical protein
VIPVPVLHEGLDGDKIFVENDPPRLVIFIIAVVFIQDLEGVRYKIEQYHGVDRESEDE